MLEVGRGMAALSPSLPPTQESLVCWDGRRRGKDKCLLPTRCLGGPLCGSSLLLWLALNDYPHCLCGGLLGDGSLRDFGKTSPLEGSLMLGIRVLSPSIPSSSSTSCSLFFLGPTHPLKPSWVNASQSSTQLPSTLSII